MTAASDGYHETAEREVSSHAPPAETLGPQRSLEEAFVDDDTAQEDAMRNTLGAAYDFDQDPGTPCCLLLPPGF
jgi:hypothetical protein